ncbi:MAG: hypothetical protein AAF416_13355 [Pseudomonadota bacterium]
MSERRDFGWKTALALFAGFNLIGVPVAGRLAWLGIGALETSGERFAAVGLSVAVAAGILAINVVLIRDATRQAMPRLGQMALWVLAGAQFAVTIAAGFFSLLNFVVAVMGG